VCHPRDTACCYRYIFLCLNSFQRYRISYRTVMCIEAHFAISHPMHETTGQNHSGRCRMHQEPFHFCSSSNSRSSLGLNSSTACRRPIASSVDGDQETSDTHLIIPLRRQPLSKIPFAVAFSVHEAEEQGECGKNTFTVEGSA
jgi:hypothetical protein